MLSISQSQDRIDIETLCLHTSIRTAGYISGVMSGSFRDKITGISDPGSGLHIMDFLMAPGWRDDGYLRDLSLHGDIPKHYVEGPQICNGVGSIDHLEIIQGDDHLTIRQSVTFTTAGEGYQAGSVWEQTLLFLPDTRYFLSCETIHLVNDVNDLFYRIDMPGHLRFDRGNFSAIYLSTHESSSGGLIPREEFSADFAPDKCFFYQRNDNAIPDRFIRAYQLYGEEDTSTWLAGMTLDPSTPCETWCHSRGYVCFIQENHGRTVRSGETIGAAYVVGYFDSIREMHDVYDSYSGSQSLAVDHSSWELLPDVPQ